MQIKVVGTANLKAMEAQFAALQAQAEAFNKTLAQSSMVPAGGSPAGFRQQAAGLANLRRHYDSAMASSGAWRVEQVRLNDIIEKNTDLLRRQKLSISDIYSKKGRNTMRQVYREQLAMQQMMARTVKGGIGDGRLATSLYIPTDVHKSWDTLSKRVGMFGYELSSASRGLLNFGKNTQWAGRQLMAGLTYPMVAFGAAAGVMAYKVDKQLTRIQKVYDTTADQFSSSVDQQMAAQKELDKVREDGIKTAVDAAKLYGSSVTDTLGVQAELAATGERGAKLQAATTAVMKSAMLGEIEYQTATKATIALQQQLHASSSELADMWAYMNSVENSTSLGMKDFAEAIPIALGPIRTMGGDLQDLGTLMTGMVSQGIEVGKAANAIKALPQRLSRPSKQVQAEFAALTGQDIMEINDRSGDNIITLLTDIYHATENLDDQSRKKVFAGLFGSFQLSTMQAMVQSMGDLENGVNQVSDAQAIGAQSAEDWRKVQEREIKAFQNSASGQFKIALESIKASLATAGDPFLEMAAKFLKGANWILQFFNDLPGVVKKGMVGLLVVGAITGPLIMVTGLLANFAANFGLALGWMMRMVSGFNILNKAEAANAMINKLADKGLTTRATETQLLTERMNALTLAINEQTMAWSRMNGVPHNLGTVAPTGPVPNPAATRGVSTFVGMPGGVNAAERERLNIQTQQNQKAMAQSKIQEQVKKNIGGGTVAMTAMGAASAAMLVSSNETVDSMAKWTMFLALGVPAAKAVGATLGGAVKAARAMVAAQKASLALSAANVVQTTRLAGVTRTAAIGMRGFGAAALAVMGPVGWTVTALATVGFMTKKWLDHEKEVTKEKREQANAMYDQKALMQDQLKIEEKRKATLSVTGSGYAAEGLPDPQALAEAMKASDDYKSLIDDLKDDNVLSVEKDAIALTKYRDILQSTGGTAEKARLYLEALFQAAGDGALEAQRKAYEYAQQIGSTFSEPDMQNLFGKQIASIFNDLDSESIIEQGTNIGKDLADAIAAGGHENAQQNLNTFVETYQKQLPKVFDSVGADARSALADINITTEEALQDVLMKWQDARGVGAKETLMETLGIKEGTEQAVEFENIMTGLSGPDGPFNQMADAQAGIVKELAGQLGIEGDITTFKELQATWEWQLATATKDTAKNLYEQRINAMQTADGVLSVLGAQIDITDAQKLAVANQVLANAGLGTAKTLAEALGILSGRFAANTEDAAAAAKNFGNNLSFSADQMKDMLKDGMEGVQDDIASAASDSFDNRMNAALDAAQAGWDARQDALEEKQDREARAFDNRWERKRKKLSEFYDQQAEFIQKEIDEEQKAEEIRQKIFDAEQERISRAAETANRNIDFNVALRTGNLDEAAKISNDATAAAQQWALADAQTESQSKSDMRVDALQSQQDMLDKQREQREEALDKEEERARRHFEKMQEMEKKSLEKREENAMDALHNRWENEKDAFNDRLTLFKAYIARDQKDLERWMAEVGISYDQFGAQVKDKGDNWAKFFRKSLHDHIREAGANLASSNMWEAWGAEEAEKTLLGMGFDSMRSFKHFIKTGEIKNFKKQNADNTGAPFNPAANHPTGTAQTLHSGGWVGGGKSSRTGIARNTKGLHPSEQMVLARKGEYVVDHKTASKYGAHLEAMQKGHFGGPMGIAGLVGAMAAKGLASGVGKAMTNAVATKTSAINSMAGLFGMGATGEYGGRSYSAEQLKNASTIANVGAGMGFGVNAAKAIEIGIMTAITESGLINVNHGDRDSLGLFQQRPSQGWGTAAQVTDPVYAATKFFSALKGVSGWATMDPWMAAQSVQRSAFSDGRNYRPYWDDAIGIYTQGLVQAAAGGFTPGAGGMQKPSVPGNGWVNSHDYSNPLGTPLYAFNDAKVIESRAITAGGSPGNGLYSTPYRSYGETIVLRDANGNTLRYAHMNPNSRKVNIGDTVPGGTLIGYSGQTGNASGPHTHFEANGSEAAREWLNAHGIGLRGGGFTVKDTPAIVHKNEMVIDKKRTQKLYGLVDNFTNTEGFWTWLSGMRIGKDGLPLAEDVAAKAAKTSQGMGAANGKAVKIGTYNVKFSSSNSDTMDDLSRLFGMSDVLSLTEFVNSKRALIPWMNQQGWGVAGATGGNESVIAYNKGMFQASKVGSTMLNKTEGRGLSGAIGVGGARKMSAAYALLSGAGTKLWQIAAHTIAHIWKDPMLNRRVQQEQYASLGSLASRLGADGTPVFVGGDLNNDPRASGGRRPGGAQGMNFFGALTNAGLSTNWTKEFMAANPQGTFPGGRFIDHIFSKNAKLLNSKVVGGLHSDHNAAISEFSLPQLSKGGLIKFDNTIANLHARERVLTADNTRNLDRGLENLANGGGNTYTTIVQVQGTNATPEEIARAVDKVHKRQANRLPRRVATNV